MKKVIFIYLFLGFFGVYAQNQISFVKISKTKIELSKSLKKYQILKINENINTISDGEKLTLSYEGDYVFTLEDSKLFSNNYKVIIKSDNGLEYKKLDKLNFDGKYFLNADRTKNHQLAFSQFEGQYSFYVKSLGKEFYIEALRKFDPFAANDEYVYYEVGDVLNDPTASCGEKDEKLPDLNHLRNQITQSNLNCKVVELNFCVDYSLYSAYNSINTTINKNMEVLNLTQLDYSIANGLSFDVNFKLNRHYILTCNNCNYWPTTDDLQMNSSSFREYDNYIQIFDVKSDINVFWQNSIGHSPGSAVGYGSQGGLVNCNPQSVLTTPGSASLKVFPTIINSGRSTLTHEFGHNFGCQHINTSNNIMYFGGSSGSYWEPASVAIINNRLNISPCFTECQTELCYNKRVENLSLTLDSNNSQLNVNWLSEIGMDYKIRLYTYNTNTWSAYTIVSYPQNSLALSYVNTTTCGNKFKIEIVPVCSSINGISQTMVLRSTSDALNPNLSFQSTAQYQTMCSGLSYTFSVSAVYPGNNPIYQWRINSIPVGTNSNNFTTNTLQNNDNLSCQIISNDPCLTVQTTTVSRIVSVIQQPCSLSNDEFDTLNLIYFPNPVKNLFTIKSQFDIKTITMYNVLRQRILQNNDSGNETTLDLSIFPNATYFLKIEVDGLVKTIKIIKE